MKYINSLTGECVNSIFACVRSYFSDRKIFGIKSWGWVLMTDYKKCRL